MDAQEVERKWTPRVKNIVCYNTHLRIVNQIIYKEFIFAKWENRNDWAQRAAVRLEQDYGIVRSPVTLEDHLKRIRSGKRLAVAASDFAQDISCNSIPASRYEKDIMHARARVLIDEYLGEKLHYVGLPANQIVSVAQSYDSVVACDRDANMAKFMKDTNKYIIRSPKVEVVEGDILDYLENTEKKFNVFEFDMMCAINSKLIEQISKVVDKTALSQALVLVVSIGGRHISTFEYETLMPDLLVEELESRGWTILNQYKKASGKYKDLKIPMRYEMFIISSEY